MYPAKPVLEVSNQFDIHTCDNLANWTAGTDTDNVQLVTDHVTGFKSVEFDKTGTTVAIGSISSTINEAGKDLKPFSLHKVRMIVKLDLTDVASVQLRLGTDSSNYRQWSVADSALTTNVWNQVEFHSDASFTDTGNGIDWKSVKYIYVGVTLDAISDTLNNIRVDSIDVFKKNASGSVSGTDVNIVGIDGSTPNLAQETGGNLATIAGDTTSIDGKIPSDPAKESGKLTDIDTKLGTIDTDTGVIAGDTTSLDTKEGTTGEAADVDGTRAGQLRYIGEAIEAARSLLQYPDTPINLNKAVTTAGTAVQITNTAKKGYLIIKALAANTNNIYVGDSGVDDTNGLVLDAGESVTVASDNLSEWYIDSDTDGEGVSVVGAYIN